MLASLAACAPDAGDEVKVALEAEPARAAEPAGTVLPALNALRGATPDIIDVRRSLAVTDQVILARFPLQRVLARLARDARVRGVDATELFSQWWDTQNPRTRADGEPHCDDEVDATGKPLLNGYPYDCRAAPSEGVQAGCRSLSDPACAYIPIGLFNRFDLAPEDGAHCGEHRILYAKTAGQLDRRDRNLVIFEATIPNPTPWHGLQGCRRLIEAWAELSWIDSVERRADRLERMYFDGVGFFPPVVSFAHFGNNDRDLGQVRTNQFITPGLPPVWTLREFKLYRECRGRGCRALFVPAPAKNNPLGVLFGDPVPEPRARGFQDYLLRENVKRLAATSAPDLAMFTPDAFNSGQSHSSFSAEMDYATPFATQRNGLRRRIWQVLGTLGSDITPEQLVERARTQTCAGCHQLSNSIDLGGGLIWPPSLGFVHVSEMEPEQGPDGLRFRISPLLVSSFLPARARIMFDFLQQRPVRRRGFGWSLGGRVVH
ncbi:MAG: hypothetical protein ABW252_05800 [Polyangiales bacterium]